MICMRRFTPAGVMLAVVAVNESAICLGPAAYASAIRKAGSAAAIAMSPTVTNRRCLFTDRLLSLFMVPPHGIERFLE